MAETTSKGQDFEAALEQASQSVAEFDDHRSGFIPWLQHILHTNPSLVPLIVLVLSTLSLGVYIDWGAISVSLGIASPEEVSNGSFRFFKAFTLTLILQQVQIVGVLAAAQTDRKSVV